jgi:hypothetical protein
MTFLDQLIICITGDASVNVLVTGGIVYEHLPKDFNSTKDWIVFSYTRSGGIDTLGQTDFAVEYDLNIQTISQNLASAITLTETLNNHFRTYDDGKIRYVSLFDEGDNGFNSEKAVYYKNTNYDILYTN